ncbi:MAG TPA: hypothetical protein VM142_09855 [Acidimicrobiales bacterium]|nr:hypothetical protein [Acidimicrobiales bacterium]
MSERQSRPRRSTAEWVTFAIACAVLGLVIGAIASLRIGGKPDPPAFSVSSSPAREQGGRFHVRAVVENTGDETAENVQVVAELQTGAEAPVEAEQVIDFLSGGDEEEVEFVFADDPASGALEIEVRSFTAR